MVSLIEWLNAPRSGIFPRHHRPEIDGLRALAVLAVLLHHLAPDRFGHAYLGVDVFFVISGYVVSRSIAERQDGNIWRFLGRFYARRWRRLWPALAAMVVVVALLYGLLGSPQDDGYNSSLRTGLTALFGVSNLYLLRQGSTYFGVADEYNPFLHTWSLGVEEQFYLVWPLLMLLCGFGIGRPTQRAYGRLFWIVSLVSVVSLLAYLLMLQNGQAMAAFYLAPFRLWELGLGCLAFLLDRQLRRKPGFTSLLVASRIPVDLPLLVGLVGLLMVSGAESTPVLLMVVLISAALLVTMRPQRGAGRILALPLPVLIGLVSYSLYLWHWPLIVLARFTLGLGVRGMLLALLALVVAAYASWSLEVWIRFRSTWMARSGSGLAVAAASLLLSSFTLWFLQSNGKGLLFVGRRTGDLAMSGANKSIPGTTISTALCFLDPDRPVPPGSYFSWLCRSGQDEGRPVIYFEGDSHAHSLFILGQELLLTGRYGISFATRGGCPFPFFAPPEGGDDRGERYRLCQPHYESRLRELSEVLRPGDVVISESSISNYLKHLAPADQAGALAEYGLAVARLDRLVSSRGASLVLMGPTPSFPQQRLRVPLSLCREEWFRPIWALPNPCRPIRELRQQQLERNREVLALQQRLAAASRSITVFDPMPALCPPEGSFCSSVEDGQLLYSDGSHLTNAGALRLRSSVLALIHRLSGNAQQAGARSPS